LISLVETSRLAAPPSRVWGFFSEMDGHYPDWHPEHLRWKTMRGRPLAKGSVWFVDEWVGPMRISARFFVTDAEPGRYFAYRIGFPSSLGRAGGSFRFEPAADGGCELIQEVHFGFSLPLLGGLIDRVLRAVLPVGEFRRHMREEQDNLVALLAPSP
jgi:uncharacterized protein YndB with AHSA1/START domain